MIEQGTATVASDEAIVAAMDADTIGVPVIDRKRPPFHYLPKVEIKGVDGKLRETIQEATFIAVNESGKVSASYQVTLWQPTDVIVQGGKRSLEGTGFTVIFVGGKYTTPFKEVADEMRRLPDYMTRYRPNPADPTKYWHQAGVLKTVSKTVTEVETIPDGLPENVQVKRGAQGAGDRPRKI